MNRLMTRLALALTLVALAAAGCGDDDDSGGGDDGGGGGGGGGAYGSGGGGGGASDDEKASGGETLRLVADPGGDLSWDKNSLSAAPGKVTIVLENPSSVPHAVEVEGAGVEEVGDTVTEGGVSKVSAELEAGTYEYYCPVGNHAQAGMEGTLTVE